MARGVKLRDALENDDRDHDVLGRPVRLAHWRWTMSPPTLAGFPVAAWSPAAAFLTPLPDIFGFLPLLFLLVASLILFWILARNRMTPRMGLRRGLAFLRGTVCYPISARDTPTWDRGLMQPLQFVEGPSASRSETRPPARPPGR